ncbi:MAG: SUMF1/EgtB/PvdO family nonheme iron enzyme [Crocinitomicaceae bacterium]
MGTLVISSCSISKNRLDPRLFIDRTPPNGILIKENFFCDQTETTNFNWLEYMFWTKRTFGTQSPEYLATHLDTLVWIDEDSCTHKYANYYLRHPAYRDYPVVGVSQEQATQYSKWRSDRVFEYLLIQAGIIDYNLIQTKENAFSIERFFNGEIERVDKIKEVEYYPEFCLPNVADRKEILAYSDSLDKHYSSLYHIYFDRKQSVKLIHCDVIPCPNDSTYNDPTRPVQAYTSHKNIQPICDLRGNVREWAAEDSLYFGGSWGDERTNIMQVDIGKAWQASKFIGFRNVCRYKKWEENNSR